MEYKLQYKGRFDQIYSKEFVSHKRLAQFIRRNKLNPSEVIMTRKDKRYIVNGSQLISRDRIIEMYAAIKNSTPWESFDHF